MLLALPCYALVICAAALPANWAENPLVAHVATALVALVQILALPRRFILVFCFVHIGKIHESVFVSNK
jgi:hypothetical protein